MRVLSRKLMLAVFCVLLFPAATFADGVVLGSCGDAPLAGSNNSVIACLLPGGGGAVQGAQAMSGQNSFSNLHSPVAVVGFSGQTNTFVMMIVSTPTWTQAGPVPTQLSLEGMVTILEQGASVDISFTGLLGGPQQAITAHLESTDPLRVVVFGHQAISNTAISTLIITTHGAALVFLPDSGVFQGGIPEPATFILLSTGLAGVAIKTRKRLKSRKRKQEINS